MALVIEDGTGLSNATSYVTLTEARTFANQRGVTLPVLDSEVEVLAIKAIDFLEAQRAFYSGQKVSKSQSLQWPRTGATLEGSEISEDEIPQDLKFAQNQLIIEGFQGSDLQPNFSGREVIKEKVDVIEVQYSSSKGGTNQPSFTKVLSYLEPLFSSETLSTANIPILHA